MIYSSSRYAGDTLALVTDNQGDTRNTILLPQPVAVKLQFLTYNWSQFDRIDLLAYRFFGNATLWWKIANANPEILYWDIVTPGTQIRIPTGNITAVQ
jgi:phage tail protein X